MPPPRLLEHRPLGRIPRPGERGTFLNAIGISIDFPEKHSRLTTFFRLLLAIPLLIINYIYEICAFIAVIITWIAMVITGHYPKGLYNFVSGYLRFYLRVIAYATLAVDAYPPFSGTDNPDYPVHVTIPERKDKYSRLKAFFRIIYIIPALIVVYVLGIVFAILDILAWIIILISGRLPGFIAKYMLFYYGWAAKFFGLYFLLIENY
jgi:hypothetical protein